MTLADVELDGLLERLHRANATAAEPIDDLSPAVHAGRLADALTASVTPTVLVVEVGCLTSGTAPANMLYRVVNDRHRTAR